MEILNIYVESSLTKKWLLEMQSDFGTLYAFKFHTTLDSLKNELDIKKHSSIVIIDIENINYNLYTKAYYKDNNHIKFIGIGLKKGIDEIIELIDSKICAFVSIENNSFELLKAIKNVKKGKIYFCDATKEHLIENYISAMKANDISSKYKKTIISDNSIDMLTIGALTEREKKVTSLLAQGLSYKEISTLLEVTTFAINQNAKSIFKKLKVRSRAELSFRIMG
jgi:DNA-binding NarL/FixJ family response regulator